MWLGSFILNFNEQDFGLGGLRLGFLATYNEELHAAMRTLRLVSIISSIQGPF